MKTLEYFLQLAKDRIEFVEEYGGTDEIEVNSKELVTAILCASTKHIDEYERLRDILSKIVKLSRARTSNSENVKALWKIEDLCKEWIVNEDFVVYLKEVDPGTDNSCWVVCAKGDPDAISFVPGESPI